MKKWILSIAALLVIIAVAGVLFIGCSSSTPAVDGLKPAVEGPEDPAGDLFDENNVAISGENFLDIIAIDVGKDGKQYVFLMKLSGDVPTKTLESNAFIEWNFMIDVDKDFDTGTTWSLANNDLGFELIANDIGYEYVVRYSLTGSTSKYQIFNTKSGKSSDISGRVIGNVVELTVPTSFIAIADSFKWTAAVRKYTNSTASVPLCSDKAPNQGHFSYPAAVSSSTPCIYQGTLNGNWSQDTPLLLKGTLSVTIYSDCGVEGSFKGDATGIVIGKVDSTGNLDCYFINRVLRVGVRTVPIQEPFKGKISTSGDTMSLEGSISGGGNVLNFSVTGSVAR